ncbi:hypothetical protein DRO02_00510 [archaeon]|nr:MAG: hypothetical protein DRO21_01820 [archaeon]RLG66156.1 MAG: hypothetical protein DRO02_00510 [archaeon]HDM24095.1 hypothetical protein [Candidatus Bathyarchaeota archaeon]
MSTPPKRKKSLTILVPVSIIEKVPHLREKTGLIGLIGRAAAIFRVDRIIIYPDKPEYIPEHASLIRKILEYLETPPYLRRRLFPLDDDLRYVGILHPLRTPSHLVDEKHAKKGELREGIVLSSSGNITFVDVGLKNPIRVKSTINIPKGLRVCVKITSTNPLTGELVDRSDILCYWGYKVELSPAPLGSLLRSLNADLKIATSKYGDNISDVLDDLRNKWKEAHSIAIAFGAPDQGVFKIVAREGLNIRDVVDFVINVIPHQGVETVRTEEAILCTLSVLNAMIGEQ